MKNQPDQLTLPLRILRLVQCADASDEPLHGLSWDSSRQRWKLRFTVGMGKKLVGKRVCLVLKTSDAETAIASRDAVFAACQKFGLSVKPRIISRRSTPPENQP